MENFLFRPSTKEPTYAGREGDYGITDISGTAGTPAGTCWYILLNILELA